MIVTIDGPSGTGKSTVARKVAEKLGFTFYDTGAMYRSVAWFALNRLESPLNKELVSSILSDFSFEIRTLNEEKRYWVNGQDVTEAIRSPEVTRLSSPISAFPAVRKTLWKIQQECAQKGDAVLEGRDMGTAVFPHAEKKFFLTARPEVRAERRRKELIAKDPSLAQTLTLEQTLEDMAKRDTADASRDLAPLRCPEDAFVIDTSDLTIDQVADTICKQIASRKGPSWLYRIILAMAKGFFKILYRHKVYGIENVTEGAALLCANHTSFYDPPILAISSPNEVHFLARDTLFKVWGFGALIRGLNSHPISGDASDIKVMKTIIALLKSGKKIVLFPEGTRSETDALSEIRPGVGLFVLKTQAPIIPAYIAGTYSIWNRYRKFPKLWGRTACVFGTPIRYEDFLDAEDKREAQRKIADKLYTSINALRAWYESGAKGSPP